MIIACLILNILTLLGLCLAGCIYFKEKYTIVSIEQWNEIAEVYNTVIEKGLLEEIAETPIEEKAGGYGFFREALEEECEPSEDYIDYPGKSYARK